MFDVVRGRPVIRPESLTVPEMRAIWDSDTSKDKSIADKKICYIYHMINPDSPYAKMGETLKTQKVIDAFLVPYSLEVDDELKAAAEFYKESLYTPAVRWLESVSILLDRLAVYIKETELTDSDKDKSIATLLKVVKEGKTLLITYADLVKLVVTESTANKNILRGVTPNMFDDG